MHSSGSMVHPFVHNEDMDKGLGMNAPLLHDVNTNVYSVVDNTCLLMVLLLIYLLMMIWILMFMLMLYMHIYMNATQKGEGNPPRPENLTVLGKAPVTDVTGSYPLLTAQVASLLN